VALVGNIKDVAEHKIKKAMRELSDGTKVAARMYYYLLDFNDMTGFEYIRNVLKKNALKELNKAEFMQLFHHAINLDLERLK
jgi:hypothetical protein